jgi:hypothetical protein
MAFRWLWEYLQVRPRAGEITAPDWAKIWAQACYFLSFMRFDTVTAMLSLPLAA